MSASNLCVAISNECFDYSYGYSARSSSSLVTNSECFTLSDSTTEVNEMYIPPATSEIVIAVQKMVDDDNQTELVIGKDHFIPVNFSNSELVRDNCMHAV